MILIWAVGLLIAGIVTVYSLVAISEEGED